MMVERTVGALLAHFNVVISTPPFMISWKRLCCSICSVVRCSLMLSFSCRFTFHPRLLGLRITVQTPRSLQAPPISRLSAPLSLPCALAAYPHLRAWIFLSDSSVRIALCCQCPLLLSLAFDVLVSLFSAAPSFRSRAVVTLC